MELLFTVSPIVPMSDREKLISRIGATVPYATVVFKPDGTMLRVEIGEDTDIVGAADAVYSIMLSQGYTVQRVYRTDANHAANPPYVSLQTSKPPRTVRLSTFIISLIAVFLACVLIATFVCFSFANANYVGNALGNQEDTGEGYVDKIALIDAIFDNYAIYDANGDLLLDEMLRAYVSATGDRYASYYTKDEFEEFLMEQNATLVGIGVSVIENKSPIGILVTEVYPDSPAMNAGVLPGDVIISVGADDTLVTVEKDGYNAVTQAIRGEAGTSVVFTVLRNEETLTMTAIRATVTTVSVFGSVSQSDPSVGIVKIRKFDTKTPALFESVMEGLILQGCTSFVFDVRNNPGGDLKSINAVLSFFLNKGDLIVSVVNKTSETSYHYANPITYTGDYADCSITESQIGKYRSYKKAVLVNGDTASAAELFTAVLADYELATVVGTTTYGKGVLQTIINLEQFGYEGGIRLTTGYYNPPSGNNYQDIGIKPTAGYEVELAESVKSKHVFLLSENEDNQLQTAITALK